MGLNPLSTANEPRSTALPAGQTPARERLIGTALHLARGEARGVESPCIRESRRRIGLLGSPSQPRWGVCPAAELPGTGILLSTGLALCSERREWQAGLE